MSYLGELAGRAALAAARLGLATGDPVFAQNTGFTALMIVVVKAVIAFALLLASVMLMIWFERKAIAWMQNRIGPNRAGPFGMMQTLADGIKLFFKEDLLPESAEASVFRLAPYLSAIPAFVVFAIVPVGGVVRVLGHTTILQVADPPVGILLLLAMSGIGIYGLMLAGWASGSKYPLVGSVRASAQMISYEAALGLSIVTVVLVTGSLSTRAIVEAQARNFWDWNVLRLGVVPFLIFLAAATAELNRPPFDLVEGESELVGGFHTEYTSISFALFYLAEFMNTITMSALIVTLFFGGPDGPIFHVPVLNWLMPIGWFFVKTVAFLFLYVWFRAALPRFRYDQLMHMGWKLLIPLAMVWLMVVAAFEVSVPAGFAVAGGSVIAGGVLYRSFTVGRARRMAQTSRS
jgi:NADH-quinone oxidoreductase subunit H